MKLSDIFYSETVLDGNHVDIRISVKSVFAPMYGEVIMTTTVRYYDRIHGDDTLTLEKEYRPPKHKFDADMQCTGTRLTVHK